MDGPVVKAATRALEADDVTLVLPYVPKDGEEEVERCFASVVELRAQGAQARELADGDLEANRRYVSAMLGLQVWAHKLHECAESAPHEAGHHLGP